jgi:hypothetical protein
MNSPVKHQHTYLLWPLAVLILLTIGVFLTTREVPKQQTVESQAQTEDNSPEDLPSDESSETANGPRISLSFVLPGISSQAGNIKPLHMTRAVTIKFYEPDVNSQDSTSRPLYGLEATAHFVADSQSSAYGTFVGSNISLREIPEGDYQIAFKIDQALQTLIKDRPGTARGRVFSLTDTSTIELPLQTVIVGDIAPIPRGDNKIDKQDYTAFFACFGENIARVTCKAAQTADLDDNGVVDGIDYNLMLASYRSLVSLGFSPPSPPPVPTVDAKKEVTPTQAPEAAQTTQPTIFPFLILFLFVIALIGSVIFFFKKKLFVPSASNKEYFIKKQEPDDSKTGYWLQLTDDNGQQLGHYKGADVKEGFATIKGTTKTEKGKKFIEISHINWEKTD